jgi:hypothetical protein
MSSKVAKAGRPSLAGRILPGGPAIPYPDRPLWRPQNIEWWAERVKDEPDTTKTGWEEDPDQEYPRDKLEARRMELFRPGGDVRMCLAPDGAVLACEFSGRIVRSSDGGQTWDALTPVPGPDVEEFGVLADGSILATVTSREIPPNISFGETHDYFTFLDLYRSEDAGRSWSDPLRMQPPASVAEDVYGNWGAFKLGTGFNRFVHLPDGQVIAALAVNPGPRPDGSAPPDEIRHCTTVIYRSDDNGFTWHHDPKPVGIGWGEFNMTLLRSGRLMAFIRVQRLLQPEDPKDHFEIEPAPITRGYKTGFVSHSDDGGRTWAPARMLTRYHEVPGCFVELSDGTLVATYGQKSVPYGCRAIVSPDGGQTWHQKILVLADQENDKPYMDGEGGHCSSVVLPDDTIISAYQSHGAGKDAPMTSRAVIWRVPEELRAGTSR